MHIAVKLAVRLVARRHRANMPRIADRIPARIRLTARQPPRQESQSIQLLPIQASIMSRRAARVWTLATEVVRVAELLVSEPRDGGFHRSDERIDALAGGVSEDNGIGSVDSGAILDVAENTIEPALLDFVPEVCQVLGAA